MAIEIEERELTREQIEAACLAAGVELHVAWQTHERSEQVVAYLYYEGWEIGSVVPGMGNFSRPVLRLTTGRQATKVSQLLSQLVASAS